MVPRGVSRQSVVGSGGIRPIAGEKQKAKSCARRMELDEKEDTREKKARGARD